MIFALILLPVAIAYCATELLASFRSMVRTGAAAVCLAAANIVVAFAGMHSLGSAIVWVAITVGAALNLRNIVRNAAIGGAR